MPIKDMSIYPPYWKQFSEHIRFERAGNKCEQCTVPNGKYVARGYLDADRKRPFWFDDDTGEVFCGMTGILLGRARDYELNIDRETLIVLTVAHLDYDGGPCDCKQRTGLKCARRDHVLALCQRCHLAMDLPKHIANRQASLAEAKDAARGLFTNVEA
jgi:hypothetical protein